MSNRQKYIANSFLAFDISPWKIAFILFLLALAIRLAAIFFWQFDGLYGQDAYAYFQQAVAIAENLPKGHLPPPDFFWPNGYPFLIALIMLLAGQTAWAGQLAALLTGAALAPLAYLLSQDLLAESNNNLVTRRYIPGILAGLIIAFAGQPILSSVVIMADMPALFWATLAAWLVVRAVTFEQGDKGVGGQGREFPSAPLFLHSPVPPLPCSPSLLFFAAGTALGLAIISRWLYVLIVPALMLYVVFQYWCINLGLSGRGKASLALRQSWPAVLSGVIILAPQVWLSLNKPEGLAHSFLLGWSPAHFWQRQFENSEGHFSYLWPMAIFYAQPAGHPAYIFPLLGLASFWAVWRLWQTKQSGPLILLLGWAAPVYLFLAGISFQNFRFGLTLYPPFVILAGFGLEDLVSRTKISPAPLPPRSPAVIQAIIILSLLGMLLWAYPMLNSFLMAQNQSKLIARQVEQTLPSKATLITFNLTLTLQHYTQLNTLELFYLDENSLKAIIEVSDPLYLLLDLNSIETQWQGKTPHINYQWLKQNSTLSQIAAFPPYVLFRVAVIKQ